MDELFLDNTDEASINWHVERDQPDTLLEQLDSLNDDILWLEDEDFSTQHRIWSKHSDPIGVDATCRSPDLQVLSAIEEAATAPLHQLPGPVGEHRVPVVATISPLDLQIEPHHRLRQSISVTPVVLSPDVSINGIDSLKDDVSRDTSTPVISRKRKSTKRKRCHQRPSDTTMAAKEAARKKPSKRTQIQPGVRAQLEGFFDERPYPNDEQISQLAQGTGLPARTVRNWFSNTRTRKSRAGVSFCNPLEQDENGEGPRPDTRSSSPMSILSKASLDALDRGSRASSNLSLDRYLNASPEEEPIPITAVKAALHADLNLPGSHGLPSISKSPGLPVFVPSEKVSNYILPGNPAYGGSTPPYSVSSANSNATHASRRIPDSRGSRKGRRQWSSSQSPVIWGSGSPVSMTPILPNLRPTSPFNALEGIDRHPIITHSSASAAAKKKQSQPYFCTSASCEASFKCKSDWARHEEAVHYCPYIWACCSNEGTNSILLKCFVCGQERVTVSHVVEQHFEKPCLPANDNMYMRRDQLSSHIKRIHCKGLEAIPNAFLDLWKIEDIALSLQTLTCGFCGQSFGSWKDRKDHVAVHLEKGTRKTAWRLDRLSLPTSPNHLGGPFQCPACGDTFDNVHIALIEHKVCTTWSCRYLYDPYSAFTRSSSNTSTREPSYTCRLCTQTIEADDLVSDMHTRLMGHIQEHSLQDCEQDIYSSKEKLCRHLEEAHTASSDIGSCPRYLSQYFDAWKCTQTLVRRGNKLILRTDQYYEPL